MFDSTLRLFSLSLLLLVPLASGATVAGSYTLGAGDEISVEIWNRADLSGAHTIGPDGCITLPLASTVAIEGFTRQQATDALLEALAPYYVDLAITLRVDRYTSSRVYVLGRVANPGAIQCESMPTLLFATVSTRLPSHQALYANHVWTWNFIFDQTYNGSTFKGLTGVYINNWRCCMNS